MKKIAVFAGLALIAATATTAIVATQNSPIDTARPGATISWPAGEGQTLKIVGKSFDPAITIDASKSIFTSIVIRDSRGVAIKGGTVIGPGGRSYGINIQRSSHISIDSMTITGSHRGIVAGESEDIVLRNNKLTGLQSDGINIPLSRRVLIEGNSCTNFNPTPATYGPDGKMLKDGDHPDCIQAWSRPKAPPVADIKVINNTAEGRMQGIFFGNHVRDGVDDGGFDRILIEGNTIHVSSWHGISLGTARDSIIRNNRISTVPGSAMADGRPIVARININRPTNVLACGNKVERAKTRVGLDPCPRA